mmetsp:Transcript_40183/g.124161  ORF Transcript_40183/g.124161 Transcript_40183/m.124161 type:complete len:207 (-) Transcript_40183:338-958(-)
MRLAAAGHQAPQERGVPRCHRDGQPPRWRRRRDLAVGHLRLFEDEGAAFGDARGPPWPERSRPVQQPGRGARRRRRGRGRPWEGGRPGGPQVPPVRPPQPLRERPHDHLHPARRELRADDVPPEPEGAASDPGRGLDAAARLIARRDARQGAVDVQEEQHRERRRDLRPGAVRCGHAAGEGQLRAGQVPTGARADLVVDAAVPWAA